MLLVKLIPLYVFILLGFIAGKFLEVKKETIASLLIYIIVPFVVLDGAVSTKISSAVLSLPFLFWFLSSFLCLLFFYVAKFLWKDTTRNLLALAAGTGNTGYFGLPLVLAFLGEKALGLAVLSLLGFIFFESTVGFFIVAKGHHTVKESLFKVLRLPILYAFLIGLVINLSGVHLGDVYSGMAGQLRGAYTILGMMVIGLGLASIKNLVFDFKFIGLAFLIRFLVWPLLILAIIFVDKTFLGFYDNSIHQVMILMSIVPLAANTVVFATALKAQPEKAAVAVLLSTIFALFYIPLVVSLYL